MGIYDRDWYREHYKKKRQKEKTKTIVAILLPFLLIIVILIVKIFILSTNHHKPNYSSDNVKIYQIVRPSDPFPTSVIKNSTLTPVASEPKKEHQELNHSRVLYSNSISQTIRYYKKNGVKYIEAEVNGIPFEFIIDTGASYISLDSNAVYKLGITSFSGKKVFSTAGGNVVGYMFKCESVKVGNMEVKNVDCSYNPFAQRNLLGNSFLSNFSYSINEYNNTITLTCKDCERDDSFSGIVEINGKKYNYYKSGRIKEIQ